VISRYAPAADSGASDLAKSMAGRARAVSQGIGDVLVERYDLN
jgi:hypothetical protein